MTQAGDNSFKALADPTRRAIFERLTREGEQTVHALTARAGVSQPMVSKQCHRHSSGAKLVRHRREGALRRTYSAQPSGSTAAAGGLDRRLWRVLEEQVRSA